MTPELYHDYQRQTLAQHAFLVNTLLPRGAERELVLDIGCGHTPLIKTLLDPFDYWGVDREYVNDQYMADFETEMGRNWIIAAAQQGNRTLVTSTFATEVFLPAYAGSARDRTSVGLYEDIFKFAPTVQQILVSGVCYPGWPLETCMSEPFPHYVSRPYPRQSAMFRECVLVETVESELFGQETEVWRLMTRKAK